MQNNKLPKGRNPKKKLKKCGDDVRGYIKEFCEFTTIQGPAYIIKNKSTGDRLWWITIFIVGIIGSSIMVYQIFDKYVTTPVLVSLATKERMIREIPFPAVTICPQAKVATRCVNYTKVLLSRKRGDIFDTKADENMIFDFMSLLCKTDNHNGTFEVMHKAFDTDEMRKELNGTGLLEVINALAHLKGFILDDYLDFFKNCSTVDLEKAHCEWMGAKVKCSEVLTPVITEKGLCYSFNMYDVRDIYSDLNTMEYFPESTRRMDWDPEKGYHKKRNKLEELYPRRALLSGARNAFVAVFLTHHDDLNYACEDFAIQGMQVTLHSPTRMPRPDRVAFSSGLDIMTHASVSPTFTQTSGRIKHYDPSKRYCYYENERNLKYFKFYSQSNCNLECFVNYTIFHCGCVNFYMPRDNETRLCNLGERTCLEDARTSYAEDILRDKFETDESTNKTTDCQCIPLCADLTYNADISQSHWDWRNADEIEVDNYNRTEIEKYYASGVRVYFKNGFFLPSLRDELYGTTDLISNIGGILSLFVGVSLITSAEIIYFLSLKFIDNYFRFGYCLGK